MLNQGDTPSKRSKIEKETNYNVLANFSLLVLTCTLCAILTSVAFARLASSDFYEPNTIVANSPALESVVRTVRDGVSTRKLNLPR
jgi:phospholipid-translocating ATPase